MVPQKHTHTVPEHECVLKAGQEGKDMAKGDTGELKTGHRCHETQRQSTAEKRKSGLMELCRILTRLRSQQNSAFSS